MIRLNRNSDFSYDASLNFLSTSPRAGSQTDIVADTLRQVSSNSGATSAVAQSSLRAGTTHTVWSEISYLPYNPLPLVNTVGNSQDLVSGLAEGSRSLGQYWDDASADDSDSGQCLVDGTRRVSSTRYNFLDYYSLSVSPTVRTDTSDMGQSDKDEVEKSKCTCSYQSMCAVCMKGLKGAEGTGTDTELAAALNKALGKIDFLSSEIRQLRGKVERLESNTSAHSSGADSEKSSSKSQKSKSNKSNVKKSKVEEEKLRQLKLMKSKLKDRSKGLSGESCGNDMKLLRKKMTSKQKEACSRKVAAHLNQTGAFFPE